MLEAEFLGWATKEEVIYIGGDDLGLGQVSVGPFVKPVQKSGDRSGQSNCLSKPPQFDNLLELLAKLRKVIYYYGLL